MRIMAESITKQLNIVSKQIRLQILYGWIPILFLIYSGYLNASAQNTSLNQGNENKTQINTNINSKDESYLFVQTAHSAKIQPHPSKPNTFVITLHAIAPSVTYFTDRPTRKAGLMPMQKLLELWEINNEDSFKKNPPNVDISAYLDNENTSQHKNKNQDPINFVTILESPHYDAKNKSLSYEIKPVGSTQIPSEVLNIPLNHVTLFIDGICLNCIYPH